MKRSREPAGRVAVRCVIGAVPRRDDTARSSTAEHADAGTAAALERSAANDGVKETVAAIVNVRAQSQSGRCIRPPRVRSAGQRASFDQNHYAHFPRPLLVTRRGMPRRAAPGKALRDGMGKQHCNRFRNITIGDDGDTRALAAEPVEAARPLAGWGRRWASRRGSARVGAGLHESTWSARALSTSGSAADT